MLERNLIFLLTKIDFERLNFQEEESTDSMKLPGLKYLQMNCISECRQRYVHLYCNCTVEAFFPPGPYNACTFEDLKCLYKYNGE